VVEEKEERNEERGRVGRGERAGSGRLSHYEGTSNTEGSKSRVEKLTRVYCTRTYTTRVYE